MTSAPIVCQVTSVVSLVARSLRLRISEIAKDRLPISANSDGHDSEADDGLSAMTTPQKPSTIASQRRQPTFSPRKKCDSAAM